MGKSLSRPIWTPPRSRTTTERASLEESVDVEACVEACLRDESARATVPVIVRVLGGCWVHYY